MSTHWFRSVICNKRIVLLAEKICWFLFIHITKNFLVLTRNASSAGKVFLHITYNPQAMGWNRFCSTNYICSLIIQHSFIAFLNGSLYYVQQTKSNLYQNCCFFLQQRVASWFEILFMYFFYFAKYEFCSLTHEVETKTINACIISVWVGTYIICNQTSTQT